MMTARWFSPGLLGVTLACLVTAPLACREEEPPAKTQPPTGSPATPAAAAAGDVKVPAGFKAKAGTPVEPYTKTGWAKEIVHEATGMELVFVPAWEFDMGSPAGEKDREADEGPVRRVKITKPFYMGKYEVTQREWQKVMGANPSSLKGDERLPVETVSWDDCQMFLGKADGGLRLPTEAEWEYACRAGTKTPFHTGETISTDEANCNGNYTYGNGRKGQYNQRQAVVVGSFKANAWGLYDMAGNVWEWCQDWYGEDYYGKGENVDPTGPASGSNRVLRGGSWFFSPRSCRSANRHWEAPGVRYHFNGGLRVVVVVGPGLSPRHGPCRPEPAGSRICRERR